MFFDADAGIENERKVTSTDHKVNEENNVCERIGRAMVGKGRCHARWKNCDM